MVIHDEPILRADDIEAWELLMRTARVHGSTNAHRRRVESAKRVIEQAMEHGRVVASWSGGKDSTVMSHLAVVGMGCAHIELVSEKDDLDYPGEEEYVRRLAAAWGAKLRVIHPAQSPSDVVASLAADGAHVASNIHSRSAALSKAVFYKTMEAANADFDVVMLGLRTAESGIRRELRKSRGRLYRLKNGSWRALPIADWEGIDVYAYAATHDVELLPVYKCIGLMHRHNPASLRKSWWLPGSFAADGQVAWLHRYYPSLYRKLLDWFPHANQFR